MPSSSTGVSHTTERTLPKPLTSDQHEESSSSSAKRTTRCIVAFEANDPENPRNWPEWRKWTVVACITAIDCTVSFGASGFSPASSKFAEEFHVGSEVAVLGLSLYVLGLAWGPMTIAPLSEYYGRTPLYLVPYGIFLLLLAGTALVTNLGGFLVLRLLSGLFASVTIANFGGTIADMWERHQVGPAMSAFLWAAVVGSPMGYFLMSFVAQSRPWRHVIWALLGICGGCWLLLAIVLIGGENETRHSVLIRRRASRMRQAGSLDVEVPEEAKKKSLQELFRVTLARPFRFLATEAIIVFAALYNGYLYGLSFLFNDAFNLVFGRKGYGFNVVGVGLAFLGLMVGISLGPVTNVWQERYYQRRIRVESTSDDQEGLRPNGGVHFQNIPEARLQLGKIAAITLPISLWWFAWTSVPSYHIHWIVPILATTLFGWSFYTLIMMTYLYVTGAYMVFSASALAGVGLVRNLAGAGFPLFGTQMFENEGYNWAGTILAGLSMLLIPIPYILERYGTRLRAKSPFARQHMDDDE